MPNDKFAGFSPTPAHPAATVVNIIPNDATDLPGVTIALNVATPGTLRVTTLSGDISDVSIMPGVAFPLRVSRVWQTGTTATGIRGLY